MAQVHAQQSHSQDVEAAHEGAGEGRHHHAIDIVSTLRIKPSFVLRIEGLPCELGQMVQDESEDRKTRDPHQAGIDGGAEFVLHRILLGTGTLILVPECDREPDVEDNAGQEDDADDPEQLAGALEEGRVRVHRVGPKENGEIPQQVSDHKKNKNDSRQGHDPFSADRGGKKRAATATGFLGGGGRTTHEFYL